MNNDTIQVIGGDDNTPKRTHKGPLMEPLTDEQIDAVLKVADPEWKCMIQIGRVTGRRLGDIARLTLGDLDSEKNTIRFQAGDLKHSVCVSPAVFECILCLPKPLDADSPLFPRCYAAAIKDLNILGYRFKAMQLKAGLQPWTFYRLRITFVRNLQSKGLPIMTLRKLLGYNSKHWN